MGDYFWAYLLLLQSLAKTTGCIGYMKNSATFAHCTGFQEGMSTPGKVILIYVVKKVGKGAWELKPQIGVILSGWSLKIQEDAFGAQLGVAWAH